MQPKLPMLPSPTKHSSNECFAEANKIWTDCRHWSPSAIGSIQATHFAKYYILNCPAEHQTPLRKDAYQVIASLLNTIDNDRVDGRQPTAGARFELVQHFLPYVRIYKNLVGYQGEGIPIFQQIATYMSETFETNVLGMQ